MSDTAPTPAVVVEAPVVEEPTADPTGPVQQRTFHDSREIDVASAAGLPTPEGHPLSPQAIATIRDLQGGVQAMKEWVAHFERIVEKAANL